MLTLNMVKMVKIGKMGNMGKMGKMVLDLQMRHHVAESDATSVWTNRNPQFCCHQINCQHLGLVATNKQRGIGFVGKKTIRQ